MCCDVVQDSFSFSQLSVVQFYAVRFISPSSAFLGSQNIYFIGSLYFSSFSIGVFIMV